MISWDDLYMSMMHLVSMKSKDKTTHTGAVIVGPDNEVRSVGYNGFVRGINDDVQDRQERPEKYYWMEHSERNAIYNATLLGTSLKGCRMYTNGTPCMDCARAIVQCGIDEVIIDKDWEFDNTEKWSDHAKRTRVMFKEAGVKIRVYDGDVLRIIKWRGGKEHGT